MTHVSQTGTVNRLCRFLARVSCKSGTGFVWYQIPALIRTLFYSKPETYVHATKKQCTKVHKTYTVSQ